MMNLLRSRAAVLALATIIALLGADIASNRVQSRDYSDNFPSVVCPPASRGINASISTPSTKSPFHLVRGRSLRDKEIRTLRYSSGATPIVIDARGTTPLMWQSKPGAWAAGVPCQAPQSSQWFAGGTADVTSKGTLMIINSGLSSALVDVQVWTEGGAQPKKTVAVGANSTSTTRLDSLAPGAARLALHISPRSGRINAFLLDERGRGLRTLGGDLVNSYPRPDNTLFIPAIPQITQERMNRRARNQSRQAVSNNHTLRVLTPGSVDARINVEVISSSGIFSPVGFSARLAKAGEVTDFNFDPNLGPGNFAIRITSDQPIIASVQSMIRSLSGQSDFVWSTPTVALTDYAIATTGLSPVLVFMGEQISLSIRALLTNGKSMNYKIKGGDLVMWRAPSNARLLTFQKVGKNIHGAALQSSPLGTAYYPLTPGSTLTRTAIPRSNIRVLNP